MITNYFKTSIRTLSKNRGFALINILGLSVGITVCLIIYLIIQFEMSYDNFHSKKDRIYRVLYESKDASGVSYSFRGVPYPFPKAIESDFPQLEKVTRIFEGSNTLFSVVNNTNSQAIKKFNEEQGVFFTDVNFFRIFDFNWLYGNPENALADPYSIILTKDIAEKYFNSWENAIGKTLKRNNKELLKVTGILETIPFNTDFQIKAIAPAETFVRKSEDWSTVSSNHSCYVLLPPDVSDESINKLFPQFINKHIPSDKAENISYKLQSLNEVHYDAESGNFLGRTITKSLINTLQLIASFILLIACVNFINLSTAQSVKRAKEVGIRKVLGSNRKQLLIQFFCETLLIILFAVLIALIIVKTSVPYFTSLLNMPLTFNVLNEEVILFLIVLILGVLSFAGFYPAIILSKFNPIMALKNKVNEGGEKGVSLRRGLVIAQFIIAQILIICTIIIVKQTKYFQNASLGFDKETVLIVPIPTDSLSRTKLNYLKNNLLQRSEIKSVSFSFTPPSNDGNWYSHFNFNNSPKRMDIDANLKWADADYIPLYNLTLIAGRNYNKGDTVNEIVVNEQLVKKLGFSDPSDVLNKEIDLWDGRVKAPIVGVIKDFHSQSLEEEIAPVILGNLVEVYRTINIKLEPNNIPGSLAYIDKTWTSTYPDNIFEYQFLDERIAEFYEQELKLSQLYKIFASIAIFLCCLGLYGLVTFMTVQRVKEIGIRKVLGASVQNIVFIFYKEFIILVLLAFIIAAPIASYFMTNWLQDFAYKINLSWWLFAIAGAISLFIAIVTVSFQSIKAAMTNPVKSLRTE